MKAFFLAGSIFFTVLILIIAFENMGNTYNGFLFVFTDLGSPFFMALGLCGIGIIAGIFYTGLVTSILNSDKEQEEAPGNDW